MLILNEEKYAKRLYLGNNDDIKSISEKIRYITRYHLYALKYDDNRNYHDTVTWMNENHSNFDENCYSKLIADAIKGAHKFPFYNIDNIPITKSELENIVSLNNLRAEKVLFVLLCMAKQQAISKCFSNGLVKYSITTLCKMARISVPASDREYILHSIVRTGLLSYPKKNNTQCLFVNFIDDGEIVMNLNEADCKELAYTYLNWKNNYSGYTRCECCGRLIKVFKNKIKKFCESCSTLIGDVPDGKNVILCDDCGRPVYISMFDNETCRCESCNYVYQKERNAIKNKAYRHRKKLMS